LLEIERYCRIYILKLFYYPVSSVIVIREMEEYYVGCYHQVQKYGEAAGETAV
jgi:hypothetical protein